MRKSSQSLVQEYIREERMKDHVESSVAWTCSFCLRGPKYMTSAVGGGLEEWGSPKSRQKEQNQLISVHGGPKILKFGGRHI